MRSMQWNTIIVKKNEDAPHKMTWGEVWQTVFLKTLYFQSCCVAAARFLTTHSSFDTETTLLNLFEFVART